jgi:prevent-host-death family protein
MEVGISKARATWSALLDRVEKGEEITITWRGKPVARLVPIEEEAARRARVAEAIAGIHEFREKLRRRGVRVTFEEIKEWIEEGRT